MSFTDTSWGLSSIPADEWLGHVACTPDDAELFHPVGLGVPADIQLALAICASCPVKQECLDWALDHVEDGIWGGLQASERRRIIRQRRGPAKVDETRTHCDSGHPFDEANTYWTPEGFRRCRECANVRRREARAERREPVSA